MEIWFYHLQSQPIARALPSLVEKAVARGWRVAIQTVDDARLKAHDDLLWTYAPTSFLAHGLAGDRNAARHPVVLTRSDDNPNGASVRFFVDGAEIGASDETGYERFIVLFDGTSDGALAAARRQWSLLKKQGRSLAYWQQTEAGQWERRS